MEIEVENKRKQLQTWLRQVLNLCPNQDGDFAPYFNRQCASQWRNKDVMPSVDRFCSVLEVRGYPIWQALEWCMTHRGATEITPNVIARAEAETPKEWLAWMKAQPDWSKEVRTFLASEIAQIVPWRRQHVDMLRAVGREELGFFKGMNNEGVAVWLIRAQSPDCRPMED